MDELTRVAHDFVRRVERVRADSHRILGRHEASPSRVYYLDHTYSELQGLSVAQDDLFRQAIRCVESGLFRAAHVMAWAAFIDFFEEKLAQDGLVAVRRERPKWKAATPDELRENYPEAQLIDVARSTQLVGKELQKALHGLLSKRNECAHPSDYYPSFNETLGYISELLSRLKTLQGRTVK